MKKITLNVFLLFVSFLVLVSVNAQDNIWENFNTSDAETDILNDTVNSIEIDVNGTVWIGTNQGLSQYNTDSTWEGHTHNTTNGGLTDDHIQSIVVDNQGNVWMGTANGGLVTYSGTLYWESFDEAGSQNPAIPDNTVNSITVDDNGQIWIATTEGGIANYNMNTWTEYNTQLTTDAALPDDFVRVIYADDMGNILLGMQDGGLSIGANFSGYITSWTTFNEGNSFLPSNTVNDIYVTAGGTGDYQIWAGTDDGLAWYNGTDWMVYTVEGIFHNGEFFGSYPGEGLPDNHINSIKVDQEGFIWIGTNNGLAQFDGGEIWIIYNSENTNLPNDVINTIEIGQTGKKDGTRDKDIWVGTYGGASHFAGGTVNVDEEIITSGIELYPNPNNGLLNIDLGTINPEYVIVEVINIFGQVVYKESISTASSGSLIQINLSEYSSGTYILKTYNSDMLFVDKIIVE